MLTALLLALLTSPAVLGARSASCLILLQRQAYVVAFFHWKAGQHGAPAGPREQHVIF